MIEKSQLSDFQNNPSHVGSQKSIERQFMEHSESDLKFSFSFDHVYHTKSLKFHFVAQVKMSQSYCNQNFSLDFAIQRLRRS